MSSRDRSHRTIERAFRQRGAGVVDLSRIGGGVPDLLVSYAGVERLVEVKEPRDERPKPERKRWSSRCERCGKTLGHRYHRLLVYRDGKLISHSFVRGLVKAPDRGGVVKARQAAWSREWPGHEPEIVRTESDVEQVLAAMAEEGELLRELREKRRQSVA